MKLSEKIDAEYDKADALDRRRIIHRDTLRSWKIETTQLEKAVRQLGKLAIREYSLSLLKKLEKVDSDVLALLKEYDD